MLAPVRHILAFSCTLILVLVMGRALAMESVAQGTVGAGSAVAGSIGAVNARADALQANLTAATLLINQQNQKISETTDALNHFLACARLNPPALWDGSQCVASGSSGSGSTGTETALTTLQNTLQQVINCNAQGKLWNGNICVYAAISSTAPSMTFGGSYETHPHYGCITSNPLTGGCSCKPGYSVYQSYYLQLQGNVFGQFTCYK